MALPVDRYLERFDSLRTGRAQYDQRWQMVSDYILPRRDFSVASRPNQLRPHRVTSSLATSLNTRLAAFLLGYWLDASRPWLLPNVARGLAVTGRDTDLDDSSLRYLDSLAWNVFDHMMRPKGMLMLRGGQMLKEFCAFGCGVIWQGRKRGFGPIFNSRALGASWWSENEEGKIDCLYYRLSLPIYRVIERWPDAAPLWRNASGQGKTDELAFTDVILCCQPRPGGKPGAVAVAKPFEFVAVSMEKKAVLEESGYDSFPYAVFRYDPRPGEAYAEGPGCGVLPDVMVLNHLQQVMEAGASDKGMPPLAMPARMFARALDRRPGAINHYNPSSLGLQRAGDAVVKLDFTGDLSEAAALIPQLKEDIQLGYFADWMKLRTTGDMTAEEVNAWKDINNQGMSSIVANLEAPSSDMGDRALEIMKAEGSVPPPPNMLGGLDVDWEYAGPMALFRRQRQVNIGLQLINMRGLISEQDSAAARAIDLEAVARMSVTAMGAPPNVTNSVAKVQAAREADAHAAEQQANAQKLALAAKAASDGGSAASSAASAVQTMAPPQGPGADAPFAPAAPFAQAA